MVPASLATLLTPSDHSPAACLFVVKLPVPLSRPPPSRPSFGDKSTISQVSTCACIVCFSRHNLVQGHLLPRILVVGVVDLAHMLLVSKPHEGPQHQRVCRRLLLPPSLPLPPLFLSLRLPASESLVGKKKTTKKKVAGTSPPLSNEYPSSFFALEHLMALYCWSSSPRFWHGPLRTPPGPAFTGFD